MEEMVSAHQIPFSPMPIEVRRSARGMRAAVRTMVMMLAVFVFPRPEIAPTVISSTHINGSLKPMMIR